MGITLSSWQVEFVIYSLLFSREVMERDAKDYADSIHAVFVETSAKNAININELFIEISEYPYLMHFFCVEQLNAALSGQGEFPPYTEQSSLVVVSVEWDLRIEEWRRVFMLGRNCWRAAAWRLALLSRRSVAPESVMCKALGSWKLSSSSLSLNVFQLVIQSHGAWIR